MYIFFNNDKITKILVALWTMKVMEMIPEKHLLFFFCIDYTVWPGKYHFMEEIQIAKGLHKTSESINVKKEFFQ